MILFWPMSVQSMVKRYTICNILSVYPQVANLVIEERDYNKNCILEVNLREAGSIKIRNACAGSTAQIAARK